MRLGCYERRGILTFVVVLGAMGAAFASRPAAPDKEAYVRGQKVYAQRCFFCHGEQADGNGPLSAQLTGSKPRDFRQKHLAERPPDALKRTILNGGEAVGLNPMMPAWGGILSPQEIDDVVVFIQTVSRHGRILTEDELAENPTESQ